MTWRDIGVKLCGKAQILIEQHGRSGMDLKVDKQAKSRIDAHGAVKGQWPTHLALSNLSVVHFGFDVVSLWMLCGL